MDAKKYLEIYLGGNMFVKTLTPNAITEFAEDYHKMKVREQPAETKDLKFDTNNIKEVNSGNTLSSKEKRTDTIIDDKKLALEIAEEHLKTFACVGGVIRKGIDKHDLQDVIDKIISALNYKS